MPLSNHFVALASCLIYMCYIIVIHTQIAENHESKHFARPCTAHLNRCSRILFYIEMGENRLTGVK